MTTLDFNSVERDCFKQAGRDPAKDRIEKVQKAILNYGVDPKYLFRLDDVLHKENTAKVIRTLEEVAKIVSCSLKYISHSELKGTDVYLYITCCSYFSVSTRNSYCPGRIEERSAVYMRQLYDMIGFCLFRCN